MKNAHDISSSESSCAFLFREQNPSIVIAQAVTQSPLLKVFGQAFFKKLAGVDGVHGFNLSN